jgi:hypothetical protein
MAWKRSTLPVAKKFKSQPAAGKIMLTLLGGPKDPDLASSNFHKFGSMKEALKERRFSSDKEVIGAVQN